MAFDRSKGLAYCGLACAVCSENSQCAGCRKDGCHDREWCVNFICCRSKELNGCWECSSFPCDSGMLEKPRIHAFAEFIRRHGEEEMLRCLERNDRGGIVYHYPGTLTGDYDALTSLEEIIHLLQYGRETEEKPVALI